MSDNLTPKSSSLSAWILAARPKTLPAAIAPVLIGSAIAYADDTFKWLPALLALLCSMLIQIATNFANDYQDYAKGSDREDRLGPTRAVAAGLLPPGAVNLATYVTFGMAVICGAYLMWIGGWPIVAIGVAAILSGLAYTGGPYPLGYNGLGDIFVFAFFGLAAVCGTYYLQAMTWSVESLVASVAPGLFSVGILVTNNHRDRQQDAISGKRTLAVKFGARASEVQYFFCMTVPYLLPLVHYFVYHRGPSIFFPLLSLPLLIKVLKKFKIAEGREYNVVLAQTGGVLFIYSLLFAVGFILSGFHP